MNWAAEYADHSNQADNSCDESRGILLSPDIDLIVAHFTTVDSRSN